MRWEQLQTQSGGIKLFPIYIATCFHCHAFSIWLQVAAEPKKTGRMLFPAALASPLPHTEMPASVRQDYEEARSVLSGSPRSAAALLRLALQKLMAELGLPGKNINDDIAALVKQGLAVEVQQALDVLRVVGNNAVHPGELSATDVADVSQSLFELVNMIIEERIAKPKKLRALYDALPTGARDAIARRDGNVPNQGQ